jgi:hypothetical protein
MQQINNKIPDGSDMPSEIANKLIWLFLLPGFFSMAIIGQIVDLGQLNEFQITFYSLVLTF